MSKLRVAAVQMCSSSDVAHNLIRAEALIEEASEKGAEMVVLPESFSLMEKYEGQKLDVLAQQSELLASFMVATVKEWLSMVAKKHQICLVGGTIAECSDEPKRPVTRCYVFDSNGKVVCHYDKVHLFDVAADVGSEQAKESYRESKHTQAGNSVSMFQFKGFNIGLSVCYDLRFPEMYRIYQEQGVDLILAPSAFTATTGKQHWQLLIQARAVENLCFVLAPNQTGTHDNKRQTYGHSMIVDAWGNKIEELESEEGVIVADLDIESLAHIRSTFPALSHRVFHEKNSS